MTIPRRILFVASYLWLPVLLITWWWIASASSTSTFFPPLSTILSETGRLWIFDHAVNDLVPSLINLAIGYVLAVVVGIGLGAVLWRFRRAAVAAHPVVYFLYVLPAPALLPVFMLAFGLGMTMKIAIVFISCLWPVLLNTLDGMRATDDIKLDVAKTLNLSGLQKLRIVVLPAASPQIAAGMRTALAFGIVLMVVSEMVASTEGIGYFILLSQQTFAVTNMWTGILVLAIVGSLLNILFVVGERRVLKWHYQSSLIDNAR